MLIIFHVDILSAYFRKMLHSERKLYLVMIFQVMFLHLIQNNTKIAKKKPTSTIQNCFQIQ